MPNNSNLSLFSRAHYLVNALHWKQNWVQARLSQARLLPRMDIRALPSVRKIERPISSQCPAQGLRRFPSENPDLYHYKKWRKLPTYHWREQDVKCGDYWLSLVYTYPIRKREIFVLDKMRWLFNCPRTKINWHILTLSTTHFRTNNTK